MISFFDIYSLALLSTSLVLFVIRYVQQEPPVFPYLVIALTCAVGNWLGNSPGGEYGAIALLTAASFLFLGCILYPQWRDMGEDPSLDS